MSEHLRYLSQHSRIPLSVMPNAGLPVLTADGALLPADPGGAGRGAGPVRRRVRRRAGRRLLRHHPGAHPRCSSSGCTASRRRPREPAARGRASRRSTTTVPFAQDAGVLMVGERTNANGSKAFREAMLAGDCQACVEIARSQARDGSHLLDLCVDYVGRDGAQDMRELAGRFATASTLPIMLDSTEPEVIEAGLEMLGGRCVVNSVNFEDGDGPDSRYARVMPVVARARRRGGGADHRRGGPGPHPEWKVRVAARLIDDLTGRWGMDRSDILIDCADLPDRHRPGGDPPRRHRDDRGDPGDRRAATRGSTSPWASRTSRSGSTRRPGRCSTRCSCTSACRPG